MPTLSVVVPAHNEEAVVESTVEEIYTVVQKPGIDYEIILVNDGSTDRTGEIGRSLALRIPKCKRAVRTMSARFSDRGLG